MKDSLLLLARDVRILVTTVEQCLDSMETVDDVKFNYFVGKLCAYRTVLRLIKELENV